MILSTICKCEGFLNLGFMCGDGSGECHGFLLAMFRRLGTPTRPHPLTALAGWNSFSQFTSGTEKTPEMVKSPWSDAAPLLGAHGVRLLTCLTQLDARFRPSAEEALRHAYFQEHGCVDSELLPVASEGMYDHHSVDSKEVEEALVSVADSCRVCNGSGHFPGTNSITASAVCPLCEGDKDFCKSTNDEKQGKSSEVCLRDPEPWSSVRSRAAEHYISEEAAMKHEQRSVLRSALQAIVVSFRRHGRNATDLVRHVWGFIRRPECPLVDCLAFTTDITARMRAILIDWITEVVGKYKLHEPVLYYTANLIDAYLLQHPQLNRKRFQLLGATSMLLAEKIAGDESVEIQDMVYICDNAYVQDDVITMEEDLLEVVRDVWPRWCGYHYLSHYAEEIQLPKTWFHAAQMFLERSLLNYSLTRHGTSLTAASACLLAIKAAHNHADSPWQPVKPDPCLELAILCKQSALEVSSVADEIANSLNRPAWSGARSKITLAGARVKFKTERYSQVSTMNFVVWSEE